MEREKVIKLSVAALLGVAALVIIAVQLFGGGGPKQADVPDEQLKVEFEDQGGGPAAPPGG